MNFAGMSPEQAMQAAAADLGLPSHFFDRMWKQESGRGKNMRSPAGAEGHFQIMPATRAVLEKRKGRKLKAVLDKRLTSSLVEALQKSMGLEDWNIDSFDADYHELLKVLGEKFPGSTTLTDALNTFAPEIIGRAVSVLAVIRPAS